MVLTKYGENCIIYTKTNLQKVRFIKLQCLYVCMYMYLCLYVNVCMYDVCIYVFMFMYVCMMYEFMSVC